MGIFDKLKGTADQATDKLPENIDDKVEGLVKKIPGVGDEAAKAVDAVFDKVPGQAD